MSNNILSSETQFSTVPQVRVPRSQFMISPRHLTTFTSGRLIPLKYFEIYPGDTVSMDTAFVMRMTTPIFPTMDNAFFDYMWFFVPRRLTWTHFKEFMGENNQSAWTPQTEYQIPQVKIGNDPPWNKGSVADYFGLPTNVQNIQADATLFRSYVEIWNSWFRDQNTQQPAYTTYGDEDTFGAPFNSTNDIKNGTVVNYNTAYKGGCPLPLNKYHDMFTSMLPQPQKGEAVSINIASDENSFVYPVAANEFIDEINALGVTNGLSFKSIQSGQVSSSQRADGTLNIAGGNLSIKDYDGSVDTNVTGPAVVPTNLAVKTSFVSTTINDLREAFAVQRLLEKDARSGTRYSEVLVGHFGTRPIDAILQRPQYLGGARVPVNIDQVVQTSSTDSTSPQGNTAGFSLTGDRRSSFTASFQEHGWLICVGGVRTEHTYQQGLDRCLSRKRRYDFYWPTLAHLGEQGVKAKELVARGVAGDDDIMGYQEAWYELRYSPSRVSGAFRTNVEGSLDSWHYADYFDPSKQPILSGDFISETSSNIDRTLAVQSQLEDQFILDMKFNAKFVRPLPMYSIPGLIDHF